MTSVILPPLKRTLTDIVDEELYNFPNSPVSVHDSPKLNPTNTLFNFASLTNHLSSYDVSDESKTAAPAANKIFNDYSNPDQAFIQPNKLLKNVQLPRRRITTLNTDVNEKPISDEDYFLFNPDIKPSSLINFSDNFLNDSSIFVPPKEQSSIMDDLNNYLNDENNNYEFVEDMDDVSDDEDDENYFNDNDFDNLIADDTYDASADFANTTNDYFFNSNDSSLNVGGFIDDFGVKKVDADVNPISIQDIEHTPMDAMDEDPMDDMEPLGSVDDLTPSSVDELDDSPSDVEYQEASATMHEIKKPKVHTAAQISASNPNHQCHLVNPNNGLPCNKQFSRPYDLIRHQETIHASKKKIFRCVICEGRQSGGQGNGKAKTFSRGDALSRHIKVKHGLVGPEALELINDAKENVEYLSVHS